MDQRRGRQFVKRLYAPRIIGLGLGFLCVAATLWGQDVGPAWWGLLVFNGFIWAHVAYWLALNASEPFEAERRNLLIDSILGGIWLPLMHFNLVSSAIILVMLSMNNMIAGGPRLLGRGLLAQLAGLLAAGVLHGWHWQPQPTLLQIIAGLPFLLVFPLLVGSITYRLSIQLSEQKRQIEKISRTDGLTGLSNRAHFEQQQFAEFTRSRRLGTPAVLLLADIDHFKRINDEGGHASGDEVLRVIAQLLTRHLRPTDAVGRIGGEEFAIVLTNTQLPGAHQIAERLRLAVAALDLPQPPHHCTVSIGLAELAPDTDSCEAWLLQADRALYAAKHQGRNRTIVADRSLQQPARRLQEREA